MHRSIPLAVLALSASAMPVLSQQTRTPAQRPAAASPAAPATQQASSRMVVYKAPTCGCCGKWVDLMRASGFTVEVHDQDDLTEIKRASGVPGSLESCHTAQVGGYVIEGHVPVETIRRLLRERPAIAGVAVAGMVVGTPGMESGSRRDPYDVTAFTREGRTSVFERH